MNRSRKIRDNKKKLFEFITKDWKLFFLYNFHFYFLFRKNFLLFTVQ